MMILVLAALLVGAVLLVPNARACESEFTDQDIDLLARLIHAEAGTEPYEGQLAVGNVVINRLRKDIWSDTLEEVIFYDGQFAEPSEEYTPSCYIAACRALQEIDPVIPDFVLYFQRKKVDYFHARWYCTIGEHNFYGNPE